VSPSFQFATESVMSSGPAINQNVKRLIHSLILWMPLWIGTTLAFGLIGGVYAFFIKQDLWLSSQALLVRDEAKATATSKVARFDSAEAMKAAQETILEVARHEQVVAHALKVVGPEASGWGSLFGNGNWPSNSLIKGTAGSLIAIRAPKGAEFGATEVIYLDVKQTNPDRALSFNKALADALQERLQEVRKSRAESIITELTHARDLAREQLMLATDKLSEAERGAGVELSDLRGMTDMIAGSGTSRAQLDQLKSEIRGLETTLQEQSGNLKLLQEAVLDPQAFAVAPSSVISSHPGLKRLREGYAEAHLTSSQLAGRFTEEHPLLAASRRSQEEIERRLAAELQASITNMELEMAVSSRTMERLKTLKKEVEDKLATLAEHRAGYANLISEVKTRTTILETAERELAEIEAAGTASLSINLVSKMGEPTVSETPIGPGRSTILAGSAAAGAMFGIGLVFLLSPNFAGRAFGRRAGDRGRRQDDQPTELDSVQATHELIASTLAQTEKLLYDVAEPDNSGIAAHRLARAVGKASTPNSPLQKSATVFYDEAALESLRKKTAVNDATASNSDAVVPTNVDKSSPRQSVNTSLPEEHPKDSGFRDFLRDELAKTNERRQHPRPASEYNRPVQLGVRPSSNS
jgi:uncharacterized protein involved in exopolysaccharide biosynthesis